MGEDCRDAADAVAELFFLSLSCWRLISGALIVRCAAKPSIKLRNRRRNRKKERERDTHSGWRRRKKKKKSFVRFIDIQSSEKK